MQVFLRNMIKNVSYKYGNRKGESQMRRKRYEPFYSDATDYNVNAPSFFEKLAKNEHMQELLIKKVWDYDKELAQRFKDWDKNLEEFPEDVKDLLVDWMGNGTLDHIINETIFSHKLDTSRFEQFELSTTEQLAHTWYNLESFPRLPDETDDTGRFKRLIANTPEGQTAFVPYAIEWYDLKDTIEINKNIHFISQGKIGYSGVRDRSVFIVNSLNGYRFELFKLVDGNNASDDYAINYGGYHGWENDKYIGVEAINLKWCDIHIYEVRNFSTGVRLSAQGGAGYWFNKHFIKTAINNRVNIEINSDADVPTPSWFNANYFYDTSFGYGGSHAPFFSDTRMKYGILQTLTNGNRYGGNSNIFYNFKFETHANFPYGFTQVEIKRGFGWEFIKYRNELLGTNTPLLVVDLSETNTDIETTGAHTGRITLDPILGDVASPIIFKNTEQARTNYPDIASVKGWENRLKTILTATNLQKLSRKKDANYLSVEGFVFSPRVTTTKSEESISCYGGSINEDAIIIGSSYPLIFYIENMKKGDTFVLETNSGNGIATSLGLEIYHTNGLKVEDNTIANERVLGMSSYYNTGAGFIEPTVSTNKHTFTINSSFVGTIKVKLFGSLSGFTLKTTNKDNIITRTLQPKIKPNKIYVIAKPTLTFDGGFDAGETVYNSNFVTGQPVGWSLDNVNGTLTWNAFGTQ